MEKQSLCFIYLFFYVSAVTDTVHVSIYLNMEELSRAIKEALILSFGDTTFVPK